MVCRCFYLDVKNMAMITPEQYQTLLPFKGAIRDRSCSGATGKELAAIYAAHGRRPNLHCNACIGEMFDYFNNILNEYEQAVGQKS